MPAVPTTAPAMLAQAPAAGGERKLAADSLFALKTAGKESAESQTEEPKIFAGRAGSAAAPVVATKMKAAGSGTSEPGKRTGGQSLRQAFHTNKEVRQPARVLQSFQVEKKSNDIRMINADGSIYKGSIVLAGAKPAAREAMRSRENDEASEAGIRGSLMLDNDSKPQGTEFYFRATGSSVSLKKEWSSKEVISCPAPARPLIAAMLRWKKPNNRPFSKRPGSSAF